MTHVPLIAFSFPTSQFLLPILKALNSLLRYTSHCNITNMQKSSLKAEPLACHSTTNTTVPFTYYLGPHFPTAESIPFPCQETSHGGIY